jgi:hypothetical protein
MQNVNVIYVNRKGNFFLRGIRFLKYSLKEMSDNQSIVLIKYFKIISSILRFIKPSQCFVLDIRSGAVVKNPIWRIIINILLRTETMFFNNVTVISKSLAQKLHIDHKAHILPLGADIISDSNKVFDQLKLLYVGTLENRNIDVTIRGFKKFYDEFKNKIDISYTIVGGGSGNEEILLKELASRYNLPNIITITGRIPHNKLKKYFDKANIGISYIPLTDYYNIQPPTKTFEYLLSGMPVLATSTTENNKIINSENGIIVGDKIDDFYQGLKLIYEMRYFFDSKKIRDSSTKYTWKNIVLNNLKKYLDSICSESGKNYYK